MTDPDGVAVDVLDGDDVGGDVDPFDVAYSNNPLVVQLFEERAIEVRQSPMFDRDRLEGSDIRECMLDDDTWTDRVPETVVDVIDEINGVQRLQTVAKDDVSRRWEAEEDD